MKSPQTVSILTYDNKRGGRSCEGRVYYKSYYVSDERRIPKIKLDLTADEILVLPSSRQRVMHPYSDEPAEGFYIGCYDYPELFGEKVRALGQRGRPRDLYDVINPKGSTPLLRTLQRSP